MEIQTEVVKEIPPISKESKYNWAELFDGKLRKIEGPKAQSFVTQARNRAKREGVQLQNCMVRGGVAYVQAAKR